MKEYNKLHKNIISIIIFIIAIFNFIFLFKIGYIQNIWEDKINESYTKSALYTDNYYRQTFAFANKSIALLEDFSAIDALENPYDITQRFNIKYLFDTSYYNGNYYSYYTILPIIYFT